MAAQGLEQFATGGPPCDVNATQTPAAGKDQAFRAGAPERSSLVEAGAPEAVIRHWIDYTENARALVTRDAAGECNAPSLPTPRGGGGA